MTPLPGEPLHQTTTAPSPSPSYRDNKPPSKSASDTPLPRLTNLGKRRNGSSRQSSPGSNGSKVTSLPGPHATAPATKKPTPPIHELRQFTAILIASFVLCFNAGYINSVTLNTVHQAPSAHVTGMVAKASNGLISLHLDVFALNAISWACFLCGACMSGFIISYETFYLGRNYGRALFMTAVLQSIALIIEDSFPNSKVLVYCCALACGLQNGLTSKYSGNAVRTTHLTGTTTDLGIALGHIIKGRTNEWYKVKMHCTWVSGFFCGGMAGWAAYQKFAHTALLVSIVLTSSCGIAHTLYVSYHNHISVLRVLESREDFRLHKSPSRDSNQRPPRIDLDSSSSGAKSNPSSSRHSRPSSSRRHFNVHGVSPHRPFSPYRHLRSFHDHDDHDLDPSSPHDSPHHQNAPHHQHTQQHTQKHHQPPIDDEKGSDGATDHGHNSHTNRNHRHFPPIATVRPSPSPSSQRRYGPMQEEAKDAKPPEAVGSGHDHHDDDDGVLDIRIADDGSNNHLRGHGGEDSGDMAHDDDDASLESMPEDHLEDEYEEGDIAREQMVAAAPECYDDKYLDEEEEGEWGGRERVARLPYYGRHS